MHNGICDLWLGPSLDAGLAAQAVHPAGLARAVALKNEEKMASGTYAQSASS